MMTNKKNIAMTTMTMEMKMTMMTMAMTTTCRHMLQRTQQLLEILKFDFYMEVSFSYILNILMNFLFYVGL